MQIGAGMYKGEKITMSERHVMRNECGEVNVQ